MVAESNGDEKLEEQEENNVLVKFFRVWSSHPFFCNGKSVVWNYW